MRTLPLAVLALVFLTLPPAHAQPGPPPAPTPAANTPEAVAAYFMGRLRAAMPAPRGQQEFWQAVGPTALGAKPPDWDPLLFVLGAWAVSGAHPATATNIIGDQATVDYTGLVLRLALVKVDDQWKVDLTETYRLLPPEIRRALDALVLGPAPTPSPADPLQVAQQFITSAQALFVDDSFAFAPSVALDSAMGTIKPFVFGPSAGWEGSQQTTLLLALAALLRTWSAQVAAPQVDGDRATVQYTAPSLRLALARVNGQWKVDLDATRADFPEEYRAEIEQPAHERWIENTCLNNLKELALGALMFAQDNNMRFPDADKWTDQIMPYLRNAQILRCPAAPNLEYGYAMNRALSRVNSFRIVFPAETPLFFDSNLGKRNASGGPEAVPNPGRHNGGNDFAYCDGHVKWVGQADTQTYFSRFQLAPSPAAPGAAGPPPPG